MIYELRLLIIHGSWHLAVSRASKQCTLWLSLYPTALGVTSICTTSCVYIVLTVDDAIPGYMVSIDYSAHGLPAM